MKSKNIVGIVHRTRLVLRSMLFVAILVIYLLNIKVPEALKAVVWACFASAILGRSFALKHESNGSQKHLAANYVATGHPYVKTTKDRSVLMVALVWVGFNLVFGVLHLAGILNAGIMLLLSSAYAVFDEVCILFFCPFQQWFLHNQCCTTCRIYNWDFAMMCMPLVFVPDLYTWSLTVLALALLVQWEIAAHRHPERFERNTNAYLSCRQCTDKLCSHKKQIKKRAEVDSLSRNISPIAVASNKSDSVGQ